MVKGGGRSNVGPGCWGPGTVRRWVIDHRFPWNTEQEQTEWMILEIEIWGEKAALIEIFIK